MAGWGLGLSFLQKKSKNAFWNTVGRVSLPNTVGGTWWEAVRFLSYEF